MTTQTIPYPRTAITSPTPRTVSAVEEIMDLVSDANTHVARLAAALMREPSLMQNVLRKANTPVFGFKQRVKSVDLAIVLLGFDVLRKTVAGVLIHGALRRMVDVLFRFDEYWNHSVACAVISRYIAETSRKCNPDDAFIAGLFHDIGMLLAQTNRNALVPDIQGQAGADHGDVGGWLVERWKLPAGIVEAVRYHHRPEEASIDPPLTAAVHVADVLCHTTAVARFAPEDVPVWSSGAFATLGLTEESLQGMDLSEYSGDIRMPMNAMGTFDRLVLDLRQHMVDALANLPDQQKIVLALCYSEGLSTPEISKLMNVDEQAVVTMLADALGALKTLMLKRM